MMVDLSKRRRRNEAKEETEEWAQTLRAFGNFL